jgi:hypothetical protein
MMRPFKILGLLWLSTLVIFFSAEVLSHSKLSHIARIDDEHDHSGEYKNLSASIANLPWNEKVVYGVSSDTPQFVVFSFDGSKSVEMLKETLDFEDKLAQEDKKLHFTYFINAAYFLTKETAEVYKSPREPAGQSNIGFSENASDIVLRVKEFNEAIAKGNEVGSHTAGHFDGANWSYGEWDQEFNSFSSILRNVQSENPSVYVRPPTFIRSITGFRAPELGTNSDMYKVLADNHFTYDSSGVGIMDRWPEKDDEGIWHIPLGTVFVGKNKSPAVAMDYSLWMHQSGAREEARKGEAKWNEYFNEVRDAYTDYFNTNYNGNRAPLIIGHHFSQWNDGVYWEAMKSFAQDVCAKPHVQCVTFSELVSYLNTKGPPPVISKN